MHANEQDLRELLAEITTELYHAGVVTAIGGNLSVRSAQRPDAAWITPSQIFKGGLTADQMVLIDMEGRKIEGDSNPSIESVYHAGVLKRRSDVGAVVHTHAPLASAFGMVDLPVRPVTAEAVFMLDYPVIPWAMGGSPDLARNVIKMVGETKVMGAFLRNHGLLTLGRDLRTAADATLMVEHTCRILFAIHSTGLNPSLVPQDDVEELKKYVQAP